MRNDIIQVFTTTAERADADKIAAALLERRLAACVQVSGGLESSYWWNSRIERSKECLVIIKTVKPLYKKLEAALLELHPYDAPEILATPVVEVSPAYAKWLVEQLKGTH
jgi:periplasmic divalent cation tolerance protein